MSLKFQFHRWRFVWEALDPVSFPPGASANTVRGAFGTLLRQTAPAEVYRDIFEPAGSAGPSGLRDRPRPFILRCAHLDGAAIAAGGQFSWDMHVFELRRAVLPYFRSAFEALAEAGLGVGRGRARLLRVEQLDLADAITAFPCCVPLDPDSAPCRAVGLRFLTPTELKTVGGIAERPDFPVLFARVRDRLCMLDSLYGSGAWEVDFRGMGERATAIRLARCDVRWDHATRKSSRTGQVHPLGGFTGEVEYEGELAEFAPWLRAARWAGVGRQPVWGKGEISIFSSKNEPN